MVKVTKCSVAQVKFKSSVPSSLSLCHVVSMIGTTGAGEEGLTLSKRTRREVQETGQGKRRLLLGAEQRVISAIY